MPNRSNEQVQPGEKDTGEICYLTSSKQADEDWAREQPKVLEQRRKERRSGRRKRMEVLKVQILGRGIAMICMFASSFNILSHLIRHLTRSRVFYLQFLPILIKVEWQSSDPAAPVTSFSSLPPPLYHLHQCRPHILSSHIIIDTSFISSSYIIIIIIIMIIIIIIFHHQHIIIIHYHHTSSSIYLLYHHHTLSSYIIVKHHQHNRRCHHHQWQPSLSLLHQQHPPTCCSPIVADWKIPPKLPRGSAMPPPTTTRTDTAATSQPPPSPTPPPPPP